MEEKGHKGGNPESFVMAFMRRLFSRIASIVIVISNVAMAQSSNAISEATKHHNRVFGAYLIVLIIGAALTWMVWDSGNKVSEAVRQDALTTITKAMPPEPRSKASINLRPIRGSFS
jgi:ABC-type nickel/cobalt efflux system permease component RcnA